MDNYDDRFGQQFMRESYQGHPHGLQLPIASATPPALQGSNTHWGHSPNFRISQMLPTINFDDFPFTNGSESAEDHTDEDRLNGITQQVPNEGGTHEAVYESPVSSEGVKTEDSHMSVSSVMRTSDPNNHSIFPVCPVTLLRISPRSAFSPYIRPGASFNLSPGIAATMQPFFDTSPVTVTGIPPVITGNRENSLLMVPAVTPAGGERRSSESALTPSPSLFPFNVEQYNKAVMSGLNPLQITPPDRSPAPRGSTSSTESHTEQSAPAAYQSYPNNGAIPTNKAMSQEEFSAKLKEIAQDLAQMDYPQAEEQPAPAISGKVPRKKGPKTPKSPLTFRQKWQEEKLRQEKKEKQTRRMYKRRDMIYPHVKPERSPPFQQPMMNTPGRPYLTQQPQMIGAPGQPGQRQPLDFVVDVEAARAVREQFLKYTMEHASPSSSFRAEFFSDLFLRGNYRLPAELAVRREEVVRFARIWMRNHMTMLTFNAMIRPIEYAVLLASSGIFNPAMIPVIRPFNLWPPPS